MIALWIVLGAVAYLLVGLGFVYLLGIQSAHSANALDPWPLVSGLFWPIIGPLILVLVALGALAAMFAWASNKGAKR